MKQVHFSKEQQVQYDAIMQKTKELCDILDQTSFDIDKDVLEDVAYAAACELAKGGVDCYFPLKATEGDYPYEEIILDYPCNN